MERKKTGESSFSRKKWGMRAIKTRKKSIIILKRMKMDLNRNDRLSSKNAHYHYNRGKEMPRQRRGAGT
jgi:hypothetical protein